MVLKKKKKTWAPVWCNRKALMLSSQIRILNLATVIIGLESKSAKLSMISGREDGIILSPVD